MAVTRRVFVVGAAAACVACGSEGDPSTQPMGAGTSTPTADASTTTEAAPASTAAATSDTTDAVPGFGGTIDLGTVDELAAAVDAGGGFHYVPEGRAWITRVDAAALADVEAAYGPLADAGMAKGFVGLYQKCPHLGCRVPECVSSQRFECPCHGSVYNRIGERVAGPAPRGMDRFPVTAAGGRLVLDTSVPVEGRAPGDLTISGDPAGPPCIAG